MNDVLIGKDIDTKILSLGSPGIDSPVKSTKIFIDDAEKVLIDTTLNSILNHAKKKKEPPSFERAGARKKIFFDPSKTKCGVVTCGGLCPGVNDVIRNIVLELHYMYGVENIYGIPYGLQGFIPEYKHSFIELTPAFVEHIHEFGGTVLGSSRGAQDISAIVDAIERVNMNVVFFIGGDGTLKAASAVAREALDRGFKCSIIGIPKTIDNDINFVSKTHRFK